MGKGRFAANGCNATRTGVGGDRERPGSQVTTSKADGWGDLGGFNQVVVHPIPSNSSRMESNYPRLPFRLRRCGQAVSMDNGC